MHINVVCTIEIVWYIVYPMPAERPHGSPLTGVVPHSTKPVLSTPGSRKRSFHIKPAIFKSPSSIPVHRHKQGFGNHHCNVYQEHLKKTPIGSDHALHPLCG